MIYFTSDLHLKHDNVIKYCDRPFKSIEEHDAVLLDNYLSTVGSNDTCFFLGDLTIKRNSRDKPWLASVISQLPGEKHLIKGNHDYYTTKFYIEECGFKTVQRHYESKEFDCVHAPEDIVYKVKDKLHLHGHVHSNYPALFFDDLPSLNAERLYDVGVDANNFKPVSLDYIKKFYENEPTRLRKEFSFSQRRN
jgi:calcineurin-like phosphoesterase family protein